MVSRIVLNLRSSNSWKQFGDTSATGGSLGSRNERREKGRSLQPSFLTRTICDLEDENSGASESYVVDDVGKDSTDKSTIAMSSMSIRRKLDFIPCDV